MAGLYQSNVVKVRFDTFGISENRRTSSGMVRRIKTFLLLATYLGLCRNACLFTCIQLAGSQESGTIVVDFFVNTIPQTRQFIDVGVSDTWPRADRQVAPSPI